jgi:hypothetical protein
VPQLHWPLTQESELWGSHAAQAAPPVPHDDAEGAVQAPFEQQPPGQLAAVHTVDASPPVVPPPSPPVVPPPSPPTLASTVPVPPSTLLLPEPSLPAPSPERIRSPVPPP